MGSQLTIQRFFTGTGIVWGFKSANHCFLFIQRNICFFQFSVFSPGILLKCFLLIRAKFCLLQQNVIVPKVRPICNTGRSPLFKGKSGGGQHRVNSPVWDVLARATLCPKGRPIRDCSCFDKQPCTPCGSYRVTNSTSLTGFLILEQLTVKGKYGGFGNYPKKSGNN